MIDAAGTKISILVEFELLNDCDGTSAAYSYQVSDTVDIRIVESLADYCFRVFIRVIVECGD